MSTQTIPEQDRRARTLGVGARLSLHPHCDEYVEVITSALAAADASACRGADR